MKEIKSAVISMIGQVALINSATLGIGKDTVRHLGTLLKAIA